MNGDRVCDMDLPNAIVAGLFEKYLGEGVTKWLVRLLALAAALAAVGLIWTTLGAAVSVLRPYLPPVWADRLLRGGFIVILVVVGIWISMKLDKLQQRFPLVVSAERREIAAVAEKLNRLESVVNQPPVIDPGVVGEIAERLGRLEGRFQYIEDKVGGPLFDALVERRMEQYREERDRVVMPDPITPEEQTRLTLVREILRQAAAAARNVEAAGGDLDKASNQAWLYSQLQLFMSSVFSFTIFRDFGNFIEGKRRKAEQHGEKRDGKESLAEIAEYLEQLIPKLNVEDIDSKTALPASFGAYLKGNA